MQTVSFGPILTHSHFCTFYFYYLFWCIHYHFINMRSITIIIAFDLKSMIPIMSKAVFKKKKINLLFTSSIRFFIYSKLKKLLSILNESKMTCMWYGCSYWGDVLTYTLSNLNQLPLPQHVYIPYDFTLARIKVFKTTLIILLATWGRKLIKRCRRTWSQYNNIIRC